MSSLTEILLSPENRPRLVDDCVRLVDDEVRAKGGLGGVAVKGAYALVKKVKPGIIREAVDRLINDFVGRLEPFHTEFAAAPAGAFGAFLERRAGPVANALLGVTDGRIARADNRTIKKAYEKLRPTGEKHVVAAVPGVGRVIERYL